MKLEDHEKIIFIIRKHPFYIIIETLGLVVLALIPSIATSLFAWLTSLLPNAIVNSVQLSFGPIELQGFLYSLWLVLLWMVFIARFTDYYLDKWVVTNKRIIDIEQRGFFIREISSVRYNKIQDATIEVTGLIPTLLNFGRIQIQTAGIEQEFILNTAPNPLINKERILEIKQQYFKNKI